MIAEITLDDHVKNKVLQRHADPSGRTVYGVGLRPLECWHCGFESC
jgi:hypothetical protein